MWQTHIMEGLKYLTDTCDSKELVYIDILKGIYKRLPRIPTFYFSDVNDIVTSKLDAATPLFQQYPEYNRFPYPICLFEGDGFGSTHRANEYQAKKRAMYVEAHDSFANILLFHCVDTDWKIMEGLKDRWVLEPFAAILRINTSDNNYNDKILSIPTREFLDLKLGEVKIKNLMISEMPSFVQDQWIKDAGPDITFLKYALLLMHCKNIIKENINPSEKLNRKRIKNSKLPFYSYHILKVLLPGNIGGKKEISLGTGTHQRLNFCMGHYKHYTAEKPLFGKHTGLYWWNGYARGNPELGKVEKEYHVKIRGNNDPEKLIEV